MSNNQKDISSDTQMIKATYIGGHKAFPKQKRTKVAIYQDRLEIVDLKLSVPYSFMTNIENMDDKKISTLRVVALGLVFLPLAIVGALWKKKSCVYCNPI